MLDVTAHMLLLLQQAQIKDERPSDDSFLPLSLSLACLLRQLPPGLAPPSGVLSFHQLDRLPAHVLEQKLDKILSGDDAEKAFNFVYSIVRYVKIARALLGVCHEHLVSKRSSLEATQSVIGIVVEALSIGKDQEDDLYEDFHEPLSAIPHNQSTKGINSDPASSSVAVVPPARAVNASEVMKRAVSRDVGNGSAVLEIMRKYPSDERIQSRGVRALKSVVRKFTSSESSEPESKRVKARSSASCKRSQRRTSQANQHKVDKLGDSSGSSSGSDSDNENERVNPEELEESETMKSLRAAIELVIGNMKKHPENLSLQRDGLLCLSEYVGKDVRHVAVITSSGGIVSIMDAMARLPDDQEANVGGISVLAHPQIAGKEPNISYRARR